MKNTLLRAAAMFVLVFATTAFLVVATTARADDTGWIRLFDGKTLTGWKANEHADNWKVADGAIVASGPRSHLFYVGADPARPPEFTDFHLKAEVLIKKGSNSGIFFHTRYQEDNWPTVGHELQLNNSYPDPQKTGSIYNVVRIAHSPVEDDTWFVAEAIVEGKHIVTKINGKTLADYVEPARVDPALGDRKLSRGTFALQAHNEGSVTLFRDISVKRLTPPPAK